jgi:hypothetical protein
LEDLEGLCYAVMTGVLAGLVLAKGNGSDSWKLTFNFLQL